VLAGTIVITASAFAQAPTDAQRDAIRSACRSDYMAHCSSLPPGGPESLQCLQNNMSSLSGSCKSAVSAVDAPAPATKSETPAAAPTADTPAVIVLRPMRPREVLSVVRSACVVDIRALCGDAEPAGGRLMQCLATITAWLSPACKDVLSQFRAQ
jgi:hypothetical protein